MRTLLAGLAVVAALLALPARAEDVRVIELQVGQKEPLAGFRPLCDDPAVVSFAGGTIEGLKAGETTCSYSSGSPLGQRQIVRVIVRDAT